MEKLVIQKQNTCEETVIRVKTRSLGVTEVTFPKNQNYYDTPMTTSHKYYNNTFNDKVNMKNVCSTIFLHYFNESTRNVFTIIFVTHVTVELIQ